MERKRHSFRTSKHADDAPWWEALYRQAFWNYLRHEVVTDRETQLKGIDHKVYCHDVFDPSQEYVITVDVKTRINKAYADILCEVWSDARAGKPGWAKKNLECDYIFYANGKPLPGDRLCKAWLMPHFQLVNAFNYQLPEIMKIGRTWTATNESWNGGVYYTENVSLYPHELAQFVTFIEEYEYDPNGPVLNIPAAEDEDSSKPFEPTQSALF